MSAADDRLVAETHAELIRALQYRWSLTPLAASEVRAIVQRCPQALCSRDGYGQCPLYKALTYDDFAVDRWWSVHGLDVIKCLVELGPLSLLLEKDSRKQTPLHWALKNRASKDVIRYLIDKEPRALLEADDAGCLPVHLVVDVVKSSLGNPQSLRSVHDIKSRRTCQSLQRVQLVVEPYRQALPMRNKAQQLPLTIAVANYHGGVGYNNYYDDDNSSEQQQHQMYQHKLIKYLIHLCPASVGDADADGKHVVHVAAQVGVPPDLMTLLLQVRPDAVRQATTQGRLPVHYAAKSSTTPAGFASFQILVEAWPESLLQSTADGEYPIHIALAMGPEQGRTTEVPQIDRIRFILAKCPDAIRFKAGTAERVPLQRALLQGVPHNVLDLLLDAWPDSLHQLTKDGESLLHLLALHTEVSVETLQYLVNRDERILDQRSTVDGSLPIHNLVATRLGGASDWHEMVVQFLLERRPSHFHATDNNGCLPIHRALAVPHPTYEVLECLIGHSPASLMAANPMGWLPIHVAIALSAGDLWVLRLLMDRFPRSLQVPDQNGNLPIHLAISHKGMKTDVARFVAKRDPVAVLVHNKSGWTPLHLVVIHRRSDEAAKLLIEQQPDVVSIYSNNRDCLLPLHMAAQGGDAMCAKIVKELVSARPDTVAIPANDGRLPLHMAASCVEPSLEIAQCLIAYHPKAAMVATLDSKRQLPLHCALAAANDQKSPWLLPLVTNLVTADRKSLEIQDAMGHIPLVVAARNPCTPLDVLWLLTTECPATIATLRMALEAA